MHLHVMPPGDVPRTAGEREGAEARLRVPHAFRTLRPQVSAEFTQRLLRSLGGAF